ncbi:hypothetical protein BDR03DRAFT_946160 [Suillus americanus]|nr:hypothetical protein BDR03DRAFT_946160 [Suillus americanus]
MWCECKRIPDILCESWAIEHKLERYLPLYYTFMPMACLAGVISTSLGQRIIHFCLMSQPVWDSVASLPGNKRFRCKVYRLLATPSPTDTDLAAT